jgi:hypothetical protein
MSFPEKADLPVSFGDEAKARETASIFPIWLIHQGKSTHATVKLG